MIPKINLKENTYKVYKTGLPFYDTARLIGVAHLFLGTASAEIVDKGAYWEVKGCDVKRDEEQIEWIIERERSKSNNFNQKIRQIRESLKNIYQKINSNQSLSFDGLPTYRGGYAALVEFDAVLSRGVRGIDPFGNYLLLVSVSTQRNPRGKKYHIKEEDLATASIGFCFSASAQSGDCRTFILPVFRFEKEKPIVISGFLKYNRSFRHNAGQNVSNVRAAISMLLDLAAQKIPVTDFVYTSVCGQNVILKSGYLGFEKLCSLWWKAVEENNEERLRVLRQIKRFLENTSHQDTDSQNQELARHLANFVVSLDVDSLCMVERLKVRICDFLTKKLKELLSENEKRKLRRLLFSLTNLFSSRKDIEEVRKMMELEIEVPKNLVECIGAIFSMDQKGWMNKFTKLENATNLEQFITELQRIVSRGAYAAQALGRTPEEKKRREKVLEKVRSLKDKDLEKLKNESLQDSRVFRAFKALFLLEVLGKTEFQKTEGGE